MALTSDRMSSVRRSCGRPTVSRVGAALVVVTISFALTLVGSVSAQAAQASCTPDPAYTQCVSVSFSGADQTFTLPANAIASDVLVKLWGAGGGGVLYSRMNGGSGGYTTGVLDLTANRTVTVIVGGAGQPGCGTPSQATGSDVTTYGGGGASAPLPPPVSNAGDWYCGASGGGRSAVRVGSGVANTSASGEVLTAGGGGGTSDGTGGVTEQAGLGGGLVAGAGVCTGGNTCSGGVGTGGTQSAGGAAGLMGSTSVASSPLWYNLPANGSYGVVLATSGTQFQGGMSGSGADAAAYETGGGGGGGYFGGGGGGLNTSPNDAPGGGGSGHVDPIVASGSTLSSTTFTPLATTAAQYVTRVGVGGGTGTAQPTGGNGLVVFQYNLAPQATVPSAPTNVHVATASHQATVTFSPPASDGGSAVTGYTVTVNDTTDPALPAITVSGSASPILITGLVDGHTYSFAVTATNAVGSGVPSTLSLATLALVEPALANTGSSVAIPAGVALLLLLVGVFIAVGRRTTSH